MKNVQALFAAIAPFLMMPVLGHVGIVMGVVWVAFVQINVFRKIALSSNQAAAIAALVFLTASLLGAKSTVALGFAAAIVGFRAVCFSAQAFAIPFALFLWTVGAGAAYLLRNAAFAYPAGFILCLLCGGVYAKRTAREMWGDFAFPAALPLIAAFIAERIRFDGTTSKIIISTVAGFVVPAVASCPVRLALTTAALYVIGRYA